MLLWIVIMVMNKLELEEAAFRVRERIIRMASDGGCFIGAALSCVELIVYLYGNYLNINKEILNNPKRDYFFLSKGHSVPALYGTLVEFGFLEEDRLKNHLKTNDCIYWHPCRQIPGIEFHSGSLGHLLSVAVGVAIDCQIIGDNNRVVVITGDGELNEGSNWEAILVAQAYHLDNLIVIVDRNEFQANVRTRDLIPLEPLMDKFEAFGWSVREAAGHDFTELNNTILRIPFEPGKPNALIAHTRRGKGLPSIEARADRWFCNLSPEETDMLIEELYRKVRVIR